MAFKFKNNHQTTLTAEITATATNMTVANATGMSLGAGEVYRMTIQNADASLFELVDVTAINGAALTITRAQESTMAQVWPAGSLVLISVTAVQLSKLNVDNKELWYTATNNTIDAANGTKQKRTLTENSTLAFTLKDGQDITLILNPATFTATFPAISWFGAAPSLIASKEHTVVISRDGSLLRGWWQVAA